MKSGFFSETELPVAVELFEAAKEARVHRLGGSVARWLDDEGGGSGWMVGMVEVEKIRSLIDGLRRDRRTHPYQGRAEYSGRAREVAAAIGDLIGAGRAVEAVPLARRAVERVTAALEYMDDSSGIVGTDLRELMAIYARACTVAPPVAERLAVWLVKTTAARPRSTDRPHGCDRASYSRGTGPRVSKGRLTIM